ncbi:MAG: low-specificity L-threonine aldolase [Anaerolineales bacterium]|nr:low-specificity L-threonine aldolase [Anaerolineales bacterium]
MDTIDLRSDTVTQPTPAMREAMAKAQVGDDVYGEDPTINRLQELAAEMLGKEAGLFIPSGTMGNLAAVLAHCNRGDEIILGHVAHTFLFEGGGIAALGGIHPRTIPNQADGTMALDEIREAIRPNEAHHPITRLITLENTHNRCGGAALSVEYTQAVSDLAREHDLLLHLDGARIFNAAAALGVDIVDLVAPVDSVTFCLSKALCAPVGSVLCGSKEFIARAHRIRKQLGGGMRQAGILAAAGIVALQEIVPRLGEDHARAKILAQGLSAIPGVLLDTDAPPSNMVYLTLGDDIPLGTREIAGQLQEHNVRVGIVSPRRFRLVTHYWIDDQAVRTAVEAFKKVLENYS